MQRTASVLLVSLFAGLFLTGCPEKKVEKEEPAAPTNVDKSGAEAKEKNDKADDEHGEDQAENAAEDAKDDKRPKKKHPDKAAEKDQGGGW